VIGSILFSLGGSLECYHNGVQKCKVNDPTWWISILNGAGGFIFLWATVSGLFGLGDPQWNVNFPFLIGSIAFAIGAVITLWMWKQENYGLALLADLNVQKQQSP